MSYHDTVELLNPTASTDRYSDEVLSYPDPGDGTEVAAWVGGERTIEQTADGDRVATTLGCHLPADATVTARTRVVWRDNTYEIDGDPLPMSRRGVLHHYELTLKRVEG